MQPADLAHLLTPSDPRLSPDGSRVAYVVTGIDLDANTYRSAIWVGPTDASVAPAPFTAGADRDARPRWSPDGRWLAFTSHRDGTGAQVLVLPASGPGEARAVATTPEEVDDLEWSPDGAWLAYIARARDEAQYGPDGDAGRPPRRLRHLSWRYDGLGWTVDRPRTLYVTRADGTARPRELASGPPDVLPGVSWAPDSRSVVFCQGRHDDADLDRCTDLWAADITTGELRRISPTSHSRSSPAVSPDGATVAHYRNEPLDFVRNASLVLVDVATGAERVADGFAGLDRTRPVTTPTRLAWDGAHLVHVVEDAGRAHLYRDDVALVGGDLTVTGFDTAAGVTVATASDALTPGRVVAVATDGTARVLHELRAPFPVQATQRFAATAADGATIDAWLVRPAGFDPARRWPVLLNIHGGPMAQYGEAFFDEFQVQAAAGYAVVACNPRGSSGRGERWARAVLGPRHPDPGTGWGGVDADDVLCALDAALALEPALDPARVGVLGGSYGGYLTSWLIGHTDRFAAACSERAVNNMLSMCHTSDIGWYFNAGYAGVGPEDAAELLAMSPSTYADRITTPLLILHSENDLRCPVEQAEDLFVRLRRRRHDVELVRFPGEGHELSRSGAPRHRLQRFEAIGEFFARHLG